MIRTLLLLQTDVSQALQEVRLSVTFHRRLLKAAPIAFVQDGDIISIDIDKCQINFKVSEEELAKRKENWTPLEPKVKTGYLRRYSKMVSSAIQGAVMLDD